MKRSYGKLMAFAMVLAVLYWLVMPMHHDSPEVGVPSHRVTMQTGESLSVAVEDPEALYISYDAQVARVDADGLVTAVAPGTTDIRIAGTTGTLKRIRLTVQRPETELIRLSASEIGLTKGEVSALMAFDPATNTAIGVLWTSSRPEIVSVDTDGRIVALGVGEAEITARTDGGATASAKVTVELAARDVYILQQDIRVGVGAGLKLSVRFDPEDASERQLIWGSSDPSVAKVDASGTVTALSAGTVTIGVTTSAGLVATTELTVDAQAATLTLQPEKLTLERGSMAELQATLQPEGHLLQWASSDESIVYVDQTGCVTALASGEADITVCADGTERRCHISVITSVQNVTLNMDEIYLLRDQTAEPFQLKAEVSPADADDPSLVYTTDNELVATVSDRGLVTLTGAYGTAVITAASADGPYAQFSVHVVTELPQVETARS